MWVWIVVGSLFAVWVLMNLKTSRSDGTYLKTHPFRRMLFFLMPTRNESYVLFDDYVRADKLLDYMAQAKDAGLRVDVTTAVVAAVAIGLDEAPKMNRFVVGRRLYQRNERKITFSALRKKKNKSAKVAAIHTTVPRDSDFGDLVKTIEAKIGVERSDAVTYTDKELNLFLALPRPVLNLGIRLFKWLDYHNLLPASFTANDPMYTSAFIANLGSLGMAAGYHHLFEWGTCPLFVMVGKLEDRPVVEDGQVVARKLLHLRFTYEERIDDGLNANAGIVAVRKALENPFRAFGCLSEDGSDRRQLLGAPDGYGAEPQSPQAEADGDAEPPPSAGS